MIDAVVENPGLSNERTDADRSVRADRLALGVVVGMCALFAVVFSVWSIHRYDNFLARRFDLGNMVQAVWAVAHGDLLLTTTDAAGEQAPRFGGHFEPIIWLFGPLWRIWSSPVMLLVAQSVAVATSGLAAYLLARRWLDDRWTPVAFGAITLMYPLVQSATLFDFHPVTLAIPLLLWAIWAAVTRHDVTLAVMVVLAASTKEQVGLAVAIFGLWIAFRLGRRLAGALVGTFGLVWSAAALGAVIPHFRTADNEAAIGSRFSEFGDSLPAAVVHLIMHPIRSGELLFTPGRIAYLIALLVPLFFLPLRAPFLALAALPDVMINLMSNHDQQHQLAHHYGAVITPFLVGSAILGLAAIRRSGRGVVGEISRNGRQLLTGMAVATLVLSWLLSPMPYWGFAPLNQIAGVSDARHGILTRDDPRRATLEAAVRLIPPDAVVSAGNSFGGHLSARRRVLTFPSVHDATWLIVDRRLSAITDGRDRVAHREQLSRLMLDPAWQIVFDRERVLVARRGGAG